MAQYFSCLQFFVSMHANHPFSLRSTLWLCVILTNTNSIGRHCSHCNNSAIKIFDGVNALVRLQIFDINPAQKHSSAFCSTENLYAVGQFFAVSFFRFFCILLILCAYVNTCKFCSSDLFFNPCVTSCMALVGTLA